MLNLDKYSPENLGRIRTIIKIVLDELELQEINHFSGNKIPLIKFEREGFSYPEVKTILNKIAKEENNLFKITNEEIKRKVENSVPFYIFDGDIRDNERQSYRKELLVHLRITEADLRNNIILRLKDDQSVYRLKEICDSQIPSSVIFNVIPRGKKYEVVKKIAEFFSLKKEVENFSLAQCLKLKFNSRNQSLTKKIYAANKKKYNAKIKNCFRTLRKYLKPGYEIQFSKDVSKVVKVIKES